MINDLDYASKFVAQLKCDLSRLIGRLIRLYRFFSFLDQMFDSKVKSLSSSSLRNGITYGSQLKAICFVLLMMIRG
jgi:hypothetical protein